MCIILFAYRVHPRYELIVAANRDEFYWRPSQPAVFWEDYPQVLAGRDLVEMGTWMGVTTTGRFAALTNYRQPTNNHSKKVSRGELVKNFLVSEDAPYDYLKKVKKDRMNYNGFNLLISDRQDMFYYSAQEDNIVQLKPGVYGLSNAALNTPWPKVIKGTSWLEKVLAEHVDVIPKEAVFGILADKEKAHDSLLPDTGIGIEKERRASSIFIDNPDYCTRSSSLLTISRNYRVEFVERSFQNGKPVGDAHYSFQIER